MKHLFFTITLLISFLSFSQNPAEHKEGVIIGGGATDGTGLRAGQIKWDSDDLKFRKYNGTIWSDLIPAAGAEVNDLTASVTWVNVPDTNITQSSVTQHEAALSIAKSQFSDLNIEDTAYGVSWDADTDVATKNTIYDKIESLVGSGNVSTSGTPVLNDFAKFVDGTDIEGRSYSEVRTDLGLVIGTDVQAFSTVLNNTTASFLTADETKLDGIETAATADQTSIVGITGTKAQFDTAVTDGNFLYVGDVTSNVTTNLSEGTTTNTTVDVNSSDGTNATLLAASTTRAGVMTKAKFDEVVVNSAKSTNVSTDLSMGTVDGTQYNINSSDGNNVSLPLADTNNWGIISDEIFDEIAVNNAKVTYPSADATKLSNIETAADVTDATNVNSAGAVMETDYDANTILVATTDDTPVILTVAASRFLGRKSTGNIAAMTPAEAITVLGITPDDIPDRLVENATTTGTYDLDYSLYETWLLSLTGNTTFTESNLPTSGTNSKVITIHIEDGGGKSLTYPSGWSNNISGAFDNTAGVASTGTITCASVLAADTVTINGLVYTAVNGAKANDTEFDMSGTDSATATDLADSIDDDSRSGTLNDLTSISASAVVTATQTVKGTLGDATTLTSSNGSRLAVSGAVFTGGVDAVFNLIVVEFIKNGIYKVQITQPN